MAPPTDSDGLVTGRFGIVEVIEVNWPALCRGSATIEAFSSRDARFARPWPIGDRASTNLLMMDIVASLGAVRARIEAACVVVGRDPAEVRLLPVSKTHSADLIRVAHAAGVTLFGENRVQELVEKADELQDASGLGWAMIGHLQTNKVKDVVEVVTELHTLDSVKLAAALDRRLDGLGRRLDVFVQVNSSGEEQKSGLSPDDVPAFCRELAAFETLRVRGLMTVAVNSDDQDAIAACFVRMQQLQRQLRDDDRVAGSYDELSMGMSGDLEVAIAHGATTVRIGQAVFGAR